MWRWPTASARSDGSSAQNAERRPEQSGLESNNYWRHGSVWNGLRACLGGEPAQEDEAWDNLREDPMKSVGHRVEVAVHCNQPLQADGMGQQDNRNALPRDRTVDPSPRSEPSVLHPTISISQRCASPGVEGLAATTQHPIFVCHLFRPDGQHLSAKAVRCSGAVQLPLTCAGAGPGITPLPSQAAPRALSKSAVPAKGRAAPANFEAAGVSGLLNPAISVRRPSLRAPHCQRTARNS